MPTEGEIARHVAVLNDWKKGEVPKREEGPEEAEGHSTVFPANLPREWIPASLLEATAWGDLTEVLQQYKLRFVPDVTGQYMRMAYGAIRANNDKYAQMLDDLPDKLSEYRGGRGTHREGKEPLDSNLVKYLSQLRCKGIKTGPTKKWADSLARHDLKMEIITLEDGKSRWFLVDAPGAAAEPAAGVGVEEGRGPGRSVVPVGGFGAGAGPSSWSAGEGADVHAMQAGRMVPELSMPDGVEMFHGMDVVKIANSMVDGGSFGDVDIDEDLIHSLSVDWDGPLDTFGEGPGSAAIQTEPNSGPDGPEWYGSWSAAPVNSVAPYLAGFSNSGVAAVPWGTGGPAGAASGYPLVGFSGYSVAGPSVARYAGEGADALSWGTGGPAGAASANPPVGPPGYPAAGPSASRSR
ncbi:hypothetical protein ACFC09_27005 [Streptomyces sp. NPDC056161]|uniref:hypothetical protein n=1 Tax=Streptomyces sp. NPDC056161 TaxID=3345732 RepID=UPI0035DAEA7E